MLYSKLFPKTLKQVPSGAESVNHQLLVRSGFIDQLMAGSYTLLPLGWKVYLKIENIIREELDKIGCQEMLMPLLHPRDIWDKSGRWSDPNVKEIMYQFKDIHEREFGLSFTHEEIVAYILSKFIKSYKDLPVLLYHFSTKFRNELRAKSGILRGREFIMKDLYSAHISEEDMWQWYEIVKKAYVEIFKRVGLDAKVVEAAGGVFTKGHTHEFQVLAESGEDVIYYCQKCDFAQNQEIYDGEKKCPRCGSEIQSASSIEVGNIFPLGTKYSQALGVAYQDENGKSQDVWFASYGIGMTRLIGTLVEVFHDEKGIIWPESVAPFTVHLVGLDLEEESIKTEAEKIYKLLQAEGVAVLFDDRVGPSAGEKFSDTDLIGVPYRVVISKKTQGKLEVKKRNEKNTHFVTLEALVKMVR
ncbi:MAG: hypothetical protein HYW45_03070 [Candidatus Daviesbacteria bacterium]|nr:MAG: hypothetical protein HYW45_03070 [Candidatus Daviesbacteria bacterium]